MVKRILRHLFASPFALKRSFPAALLTEIEAAIHASEKSHKGEIRFAVETALPLPAVIKGVSARQAAGRVFSELGVWDTQDNSGVLIYLLLADRDLEIVADRGIAACVEQEEWDDIAQAMEQQFRMGNFRDGSLEGIRRVTEILAHHFPPGTANPDELPNKPVIIKR